MANEQWPASRKDQSHAELVTLAHAVARTTMAYPFKVWGFGEGIALEALWQAADVLSAPAYRAFVLDIFEHWLARQPQIVEADHSAPGGLLLEAAAATDDARLRALALRLAAHMHDLPGGPHGARFHRPTHPDFHDYLYVDCMEVDAPFLCALAAATGETAYFDRAANQILAYAALLQDTMTGLFYHQYNRATGQINGSFWGRGNGWALLGLAKTLRLLPPTHDAYDELRNRYMLLANALAERQLSTGDWPTVLDWSQAYPEASLAAMFGYGIELGIRSAQLPASLGSVADRAWAATLARIDHEGRLLGVSVATPPGDAVHYNRIATGSGFPWGQGPTLLWIVERIQAET